MKQTQEKPLTNEEINQKMYEMMQTRQRLEAETRQRYNLFSPEKNMLLQTQEKPLTNEEINQKMYEMMQTRQRLEAEINNIVKK